ncbi:MAG: 30S ribosomal protein S19e [Candidatus Heimdallarchaeaceae archaeon]
MPTAYDVPSNMLIEKIKEELKKEVEVKPPEWASYAKTGVHRDSAPVQPDWWYIRAAAILRKIYLKGPIGVSKLRILYGGRHRRGVKPEHFAKGSGAIIRTILQQLEKAGFVQNKTGHGSKGRVVVGRVVTPKGHSFIDKLATEIKKQIPELEKY